MLWLETGYKVAYRTCANRSVQTPSWHSGETTYAGSLPRILLHSVAWDKMGRGNSLNATMPTSPPGEHSLAESWHLVCEVMPYIHCAKHSADVNEAWYSNVKIEHDNGKYMLFYCCFDHYRMLIYTISACEVCMTLRKPAKTFKLLCQSSS